VWSADGRHIYYWSNHHRRTTHIFAGDVFRMTLPDRSIEQITPGGQRVGHEGWADWSQPTLSPAGDRLAVAVHDHDALSPRQLFFVHIASGLATPVLDLRSWNNVDWTDEHPSWSLDGERLAFVSDRDGDLEIFVLHLETGDLRQITHNDVLDSRPSWSPDGRRIAFSSRRAGQRDIFVMNADGSAPVPLTNSPFGAYDPNWSPDGAFIAYVGNSDAAPYPNWDIYVMDSDGRENRRLTTDRGTDRTPAWSPVPLPESFLPSAVEVQSWGAIKKAWRR
jgi:TolB protein